MITFSLLPQTSTPVNEFEPQFTPRELYSSSNPITRDFKRNKETVIYAASGESNDNFGCSIDLYGNLSVVGAYSANINGVSSGVAYLYRVGDSSVSDTGTGWLQEARVTAEESHSHDFFGWAVAAHDNVVIVGAYMAQGDNVPVGAAYVYTLRNKVWSRTATLRATRSASGGSSAEYVYFGWAVDVHRDTAFVGAYGDSERGSFSGSVYVFSRSYGKGGATSWSQSSKLVASDGAPFDSFGWCLAAQSDTLLVGAYGDTSSSESFSGSAYIFSLGEDGSWSEFAKLLPPDGSRHDFFGWSVALWQDMAVVGAHWSSVDNQATGAAYLYKRQWSASTTSWSWALHTKLTARDSDRTLYFGYSVAMHGDVVAVSAFGDSYNTERPGYVYLFSYQPQDSSSEWAWREEARLTSNKTDYHGDFGASVSLWDGMVVVGATHADGVTGNTGAVFAYTAADSSQRTYFPVNSSTFVLLAALVPIIMSIFICIALVVIVKCFPAKDVDQHAVAMVEEAMNNSSVHSVSNLLAKNATFVDFKGF